MTQSATEAQPKAKKNKLSSGFFRFVLTRFLLIIPTVFILVTIVFFVMRATGDPISAALGGRLTPEELQKRIHAAGYDRPLIVQYIDYLGGLLHGDLGTTLTDNQKVSTILLTMVPLHSSWRSSRSSSRSSSHRLGTHRRTQA